MDYGKLSITQLHDLYVNNKVTPLIVVESIIKKIKTNKDNVMEKDMFESALNTAKQLSLQPVEVDNLLWGIPYLIKDNLSTKGVETTGSSNILNGFIPLYDAEVVQRLNQKHAIALGKTTLDELGMGGSGKTGHKGYTYNPHDASHKHMIGGSSAGSAAAVAAGLVPFALGSDTGDSIRKPASHGGLVGIKPTWSRISRYGLFPFSISLDTVGFFTRNVKDSSILLTYLAGHDKKDATSSTKEVDDYINVDGQVKGVRIAIIKQIATLLKESSLKEAFDRSISSLKDKGAIIEYVDMDINLLNAIYPTYFVISSAEATSNNAALDGVNFGAQKDGQSYEQIIKNTRTSGFGNSIKNRFILGSYSLKKENQEEVFAIAQKARRLIVEAVNNILNKYDFIYLPAASDTAPTFDHVSDNNDLDQVIIDNHLALGNFAGLPSITVPLTIKQGLPFGVNIMGRAFSEKKLYSLALAVEQITGLTNLSAEDK